MAECRHRVEWLLGREGSGLLAAVKRPRLKSHHPHMSYGLHGLPVGGGVPSVANTHRAAVSTPALIRRTAHVYCVGAASGHAYTYRLSLATISSDRTARLSSSAPQASSVDRMADRQGPARPPTLSSTCCWLVDDPGIATHGHTGI